jgi:hypothetical protein
VIVARLTKGGFDQFADMGVLRGENFTTLANEGKIVRWR